MGYGDSIPSGGQHRKKPLTKGQIKKLQAAYANAGAISEGIKNLEQQEQADIQKEVEVELKMLF